MESDSPPIIPYQAYKSKRHSRNDSNSLFIPNVTPPSISRPPSTVANQPANPVTISHNRHPSVDRLDDVHSAGFSFQYGLRPGSSASNTMPLETRTNGFSHSTEPSSPATSSRKSSISLHASVIPPMLLDTEQSNPSLNGKLHGNGDAIMASSSLPSSVGNSDKPLPAIRRQSKFRHVPLRNSKSPLPSSPLRPPSVHVRSTSLSSTSHQPDQSRPHVGPEPRSRVTSVSSIAFGTPVEKVLPPIISPETVPSTPNTPYHGFRASSDRPLPQPAEALTLPSHPASNDPSPRALTPISATPSSAPSVSPTPRTVALPTTNRLSAPYRPGFQPKGVYRPRTDEFVEIRRKSNDRDRIERAKLERRLEKLLDLHFPREPSVKVAPLLSNRRASSFFDFDLSDGGIWRGIMQQGGKGDIRASEQRITPWQEDSAVSKCPLCSSSFHPLSNRKHHCRLCGKIICSLPVKHPQRPVTCSILFIVDAKTRQIEEVGEGVDYGVRKRRSSIPTQQGKEKGEVLSDEEKFLKGVRICRQCRPILSRQQFHHEANHVPDIIKLYHALIILEKEMEDSLPQFQELLLSLTNDGQPTKDASAVRKRLLDAFSQYDGLAKRIRNLPTTGGPGNSHHRVQMAIFSRSNLFLQKNMVPLQSIPRSPKPSQQPGAQQLGHNNSISDLDSELVRILQPLFEQETQLESYVEEAKAHRKFEDAKTLKANLAEIRAEIDRIFAIADANSTEWKGEAKSVNRAT